MLNKLVRMELTCYDGDGTMYKMETNEKSRMVRHTFVLDDWQSIKFNTLDGRYTLTLKDMVLHCLGKKTSEINVDDTTAPSSHSQSSS